MKRFLLSFAIVIALVSPAAAQINASPKVQASLIAESGEIAPGASVTVALAHILVQSGRSGPADRDQMVAAAGLESQRDRVALSQTPAGRAADAVRL
jgi:hypothetical protein